MAAVMTSRQQSGGPPPLPARNNSGIANVPRGAIGRVPAQSNNPAKHLNHAGRSHSVETPPHVPPSISRTASASNPHHKSSNPPLPSRNSTQHGIHRRSFETNSFIDRNTARAFSQGGSPRIDEGLPPPPPSVSSIPHSRSASASGTSQKHPSTSSTSSTSSASSHQKYNDVFEVDEPPPPPPPVTRAPKMANRGLPDLESRFIFHGYNDFPAPDEFQNIRKRYPSNPQGGREAPGIPMGSFYHKDPASVGYL